MSKRILFVDDDPVLVRTYATVLQNQRGGGWEVRSATSAQQALDMASRTVFDVIVADVRMPGMSGVQLIEEVCKRHPRISRVILSGSCNQEQVARFLGATHQFIPKPVDLDTLRDTLLRICNLDSLLLDENLRALVGQFKVLPSFPTLYVEIMGELNSADPSIERIAEIVAQDPAMTAKMLQIVNSAVFGLTRKISNPFEAVQFLGTNTVRSLVLSVHVFSSFNQTVKGFSIDQFWQHALRSAALAGAICRNLKTENSVAEEAYIAGMLHDVGKLMLASSRTEQYQKAAALAAERHVPLHEVEPEIFGANHASVGAYLLGLWGLPTPIVEAVGFHHAPGRSDPKVFGPLTAVHVADGLEHELSSPESEAKPALDMEYLTAIGLAGNVDAWRDEAVRLFAPPGE